MGEGVGMKPIRLSVHAQGYLARRGFTATEVEEAIRTAPWEPSREHRLQCSKEIPFNGEWNGKVYAIKQIRPVFVDEPTEIVVITVYTFFY